jgi:hypothetical protein
MEIRLYMIFQMWQEVLQILIKLFVMFSSCLKGIAIQQKNLMHMNYLNKGNA